MCHRLPEVARDIGDMDLVEPALMDVKEGDEPGLAFRSAFLLDAIMFGVTSCCNIEYPSDYLLKS